MQNGQKPKIAIMAEKPSVARDLARAVGANQRGDGYLHGNGYWVTWAIGHIVTLPEPHQIKPAWKAWSFAHLPMLPVEWPLTIVEKTKQQFEVVQRILQQCDEVICATDAGREGELIFRYIYELAKCTKPVKRLWISSLTNDAIQAGLNSLKSSAAYDPLADAARARSRADWLIGMNLSRAYALSSNEQLFVGRVQTPTLAMVVDRDTKIQNFKPEEFIVLEGKFLAPNGAYEGYYLGAKQDVSNPVTAKEKRLKKELEVDAILARMKNGSALVASLDGKTTKQQAPFLYDLTELQRHCNRLFGFTATQTLQLAQNLYEKHKAISYPRTDSRHLSTSVAQTLPKIISNIRAPYESLIAPNAGKVPLSNRFVDDAKVSDHHAIIPTTSKPESNSMSADEQRVFDLICRRLLMAWSLDFITQVTTVITEIEKLDLFKTQGTVVLEPGWKSLEVKGRGGSQESILPFGLAPALAVKIKEVTKKKKSTEPPPHLTEATLLTGMESAGRNLDDKELAEIMRETGIGTPATRANIIEILISRNYITRKEKSLVATPLGAKLISLVHPSVKSAELTARWEQKLSEIQENKYSLSAFMKELEGEVSERVAEIAKGRCEAKNEAIVHSRKKRMPSSADQLRPLLKEYFGFDSFRTNQEQVCQSVVKGKDVLLVMPTGAGKSLCYQIPGLARGGNCIVVSPLLALIEDQVTRLQKLGLSADRIHSGRSREDSRRVCHRYLNGELDFLFIAPERLSVPGFPEFLRKGVPSLIAIDEAHCISQWGHDFRPDYRILGERLKELRPAPVIALTATATPTVQEDICRQLGLVKEERIIQGFRRTNIAIEAVELPPSDRPSAIVNLLKRTNRLPAIVYVPTRQKAEEITKHLSVFRTGSYHAGMPTSARDKVQSQFLHNEIDVMVATVAFGMGIDKPNIRTVIHAALPGSIENYYQEIGRAGRDGLESRAYLLHSFIDQKTHEFFFDMNYPEEAKLRSIFGELGTQQIAKASVHRKLKGMSLEVFERALEQLWVHKGVVIDPEENMLRGDPNWEKSYLMQRDQKRQHLKQMANFASGGVCRMQILVKHFGDQKDSGAPCGICDICRPTEKGSLVELRALSPDEKKLVASLLGSLQNDDNIAAGRLFQNLVDAKKIVNRGEFEKVLTLLVRMSWIKSEEVSFEKNGQNISYRKVSLYLKGKSATATDLDNLKVAWASSRSLENKPRKKTKRRGKSERVRADLDNASALGIEPLRQWRLGQAQQKKIPAFRILTDRALLAICENKPRTITDLLELTGISRKSIAQYGDDILRIMAKSGG